MNAFARFGEKVDASTVQDLVIITKNIKMLYLVVVKKRKFILSTEKSFINKTMLHNCYMAETTRQ